MSDLSVIIRCIMPQCAFSFDIEITAEVLGILLSLKFGFLHNFEWICISSHTGLIS